MEYHDKYLKYKNKYNNLKTYIEIQKGGKFMGRGAWGEVYDLKSSDDSDNQTFKKMYQNEQISFYTMNTDSSDIKNESIINKVSSFLLKSNSGSTNKIIEKHQTNTTDFINWIETTTYDNIIIKKFISKPHFEAEMTELYKVNEIYNQNESYITIVIPEINNIKVYGVEIKSKQPYYITFGTKCSTNLNINNTNIKKFIINILESIKIINDKDYYHNDIKISNIIYCNDRFNLIDWGASRTVTDINSCGARGDPIYSSPIKLYITYSLKTSTNIVQLQNKNIPLATLLYEAKIYNIKLGFKNIKQIQMNKKYDDWEFFRNNSRYKDATTNLLINQHESFLSVLEDIKIKHKQNKEKIDLLQFICDKYKKSFDVYMFGMTLFHTLYLYDIYRYNILMNFIKELISLTNPIDIDIALDKAKKLQIDEERQIDIITV